MAGWSGLGGGMLGLLAGLAQTTAGSRIPDWTGHKAEPAALGLLTIGLSTVAVLCALLLLRTPGITPERRIAAAVGLLAPGGLCFSTVGFLWFTPGVLLLLASVYALLAGDPVDTRLVVTRTRLPLLISLLGTFEVLMAVSAGSTITILAGVVGGLALMTAPWAKGVAVSAVLLLIGTVPFAVLTWWTVVSPLLAVLALAMGLVLLHPGSHTRSIHPTNVRCLPAAEERPTAVRVSP